MAFYFFIKHPFRFTKIFAIIINYHQIFLYFIEAIIFIIPFFMVIIFISDY
jgi:hypothetical protein